MTFPGWWLFRFLATWKCIIFVAHVSVLKCSDTELSCTLFSYIWSGKQGFTDYSLHPTKICLVKVNIKDTTERFEIRSKLSIKTPEQRHWRRSSFFIINFEVEVISSIFIASFEQVNVCSVIYIFSPTVGKCRTEEKTFWAIFLLWTPLLKWSVLTTWGYCKISIIIQSTRRNGTEIIRNYLHILFLPVRESERIN